MEYTVVSNFRDKNTDELFVVGDVYVTEDPTRATELRQKGFISGESQIINSPLEGNVAEVIAEITKELGPEKLSELLQQEIEGKDRKTVKEHIESLLKDE